MAQKTRAEILTAITTLLADNNNNDISEADVRSVLTDIKDSFLNLSDDTLYLKAYNDLLTLEEKFDSLNSLILMQGTVTIGNIAGQSVGYVYPFNGDVTYATKIQGASSQDIARISFADLGTSSYQTLIEVNSLVDPIVDNDTTFCVLNKTNTSFDFSIQGTGVGSENVSITITIINLTL